MNTEHLLYKRKINANSKCSTYAVSTITRTYSIELRRRTNFVHVKLTYALTIVFVIYKVFIRNARIVQKEYIEINETKCYNLYFFTSEVLYIEK